MAVTVTHATTATLPDDPSAEIGSDEWNAGHTVTNAMDKTILDAKGDIIAASAADTPAKVTVGANDTILMADSSQSAGLKWVASQTPSTQAFGDAAAEGTADTYARGDHKHAMPSDGSPGHVMILPAAVILSASVGTWATVNAPSADYLAGTEDPAYPFGGYCFTNESAVAQNDAFSFPVWLGVGTWTIEIICRYLSANGIMTVKIDGSSVGTLDAYSAGTGRANLSLTGITVATSGSKTIQILMATKHASSSGYRAYIFAINFRRTA